MFVRPFLRVRIFLISPQKRFVLSIDFFLTHPGLAVWKFLVKPFEFPLHLLEAFGSSFILLV